MRKYVNILLITNLLVILIGTLFPFNFSLTEEFSIEQVFKSFYHVSNSLDFMANILLFVSFGFFSSWALKIKGFEGIKLALAALTISVSSSAAIEVIQIFLPHRFSTKADIFANSIGGFLGYIGFSLFSWCLSISPTKLRKIFKPRHLLLCLVTYLIVIICIARSLADSVSLTNWNTNFPLVIGNEATGDRPWHGLIERLVIYDRALPLEDIGHFLSTEDILSTSKDSILGDYFISDSETYSDRTNQLPVLAWKGQFLSEQEDNKGAIVTPQRWLETLDTPKLLSEKIRQTSQFTLYTIIATKEIEQSGPARIISLSKDPYNRNFTLAQEKNNLVFRLRTPLMGKDGGKFKLIGSNVFSDTNNHRLVISYHNSILKIYLDDLNTNFSWQLMPEAALFQQFLSNNFEYEAMFSYIFFYYLIMFVPLGFLLALLSLTLRQKKPLNYLFLLLTITSVAGVIQASLKAGVQAINLKDFLLGIAIATVTFLTVKMLIFIKYSSKLIENQIKA